MMGSCIALGDEKQEARQADRGDLDALMSRNERVRPWVDQICNRNGKFGRDEIGL
jgi:hypothetical protein